MIPKLELTQSKAQHNNDHTKTLQNNRSNYKCDIINNMSITIERTAAEETGVRLKQINDQSIAPESAVVKTYTF